MGKPVPKTSALVVSAIRKLREVQGSTSREIMNFITAEYDVPGSRIKKQLHAALKRGLEYGILKRQHGHYVLSTDGRSGGSFSGGAGTIQEEDGSIDPTDACGKKRRKYRKCKKTRRCARGCVPNRRKKKSCGKKRRHSRRKGCPKRCVGGGGGAGGGNIEGENLALSPLDNNNNNANRSNREQIKSQRSNHSSRTTRRSRSRSRSQSRSRSHSRSRSGNSSRNDGRENSSERREKQAE